MKLPPHTLDAMLVTACEKEDFNGARELIDQGASPNATNEFHEPVLVVAAGKGSVSICDLLLSRGADVFATDGSGWAAIHRAANYGEVDVCRVLLAHGAPVTQSVPNKQTAMHIAAAGIAGDRLGVCSLLLQHGANVDERDDDLATPLIKAASRGCDDAVEFLARNGADLDAQTKTGNTAMGLVRGANRTSTMHLLRAYGAKPPSDLVIMKKMTMRQAAARGGYVERLMELMDRSEPEGEGDDIASLRGLAEIKKHQAVVAFLDSLQARHAVSSIARLRLAPSP